MQIVQKLRETTNKILNKCDILFFDLEKVINFEILKNNLFELLCFYLKQQSIFKKFPL